MTAGWYGSNSGSGGGTVGTNDQQHAIYNLANTTVYSGTTVLPVLANLKPNDTLTVKDLEAILKYNGFLRQQDLAMLQQQQQQQQQQFLLQQQLQQQQQQQPKQQQRQGPCREDELESSSLWPTSSQNSNWQSIEPGIKTSSRSSGGSGGGGVVAFPQPSLLSYKDLQKGTTVAGIIVGMILGTTILPNLWLVGSILGGMYGYDIANHDKHPIPPSNIGAKGLMEVGRKLAKSWLQLYDYWKTLWFLYKTGQLSYEYYKSYSSLDEKFQIQAKIDAWNARFQEGKKMFDQWEKEHEVGRTVLAGLRTIWLVEEQSLRRAKKKSRYRIVQACYDVADWFGRFLRGMRKRIRTWMESDGDGLGWREFLRGVWTDVQTSSEWDAMRVRLGAVIAAMMAVNLLGAIFSISPPFLFSAAALFGLIWPTWATELVARLRFLVDETRARGRGEGDRGRSPSSTGIRMTSSPVVNAARLLGRYDKNKYHYYRRLDGSKRYYRTGQPQEKWLLFGLGQVTEKKPQQPIGLSWFGQGEKAPKQPQASKASSKIDRNRGGIWPWKKDINGNKNRKRQGRDFTSHNQWNWFGLD